MSDCRRIAIYPGTFDPVHNGHLDIIERAARLFDKLIVAAGSYDGKRTLFSLEERAELLRAVCGHLDNVEVDSFSGLLTDYVRGAGAVVIVKGLRTADDFQSEQQMAMMNRHLLPEADTLLLMTSPEAMYISSTLIKEVQALGGDVGGLVPPVVAEALARKNGQA